MNEEFIAYLPIGESCSSFDENNRDGGLIEEEEHQKPVTENDDDRSYRGISNCFMLFCKSTKLFLP